MQQIVKNMKDVKAMNVRPTLTLSLVAADNVKTKRSTKNGNGARYPKYDAAIQPHVLWLQQAIAESKDKIIRVRSSDIAKVMGTDFVKKNPTSIYWGLKYVLYFKDIVVDTGTNKEKEKLLVMRAKKQGDVLPPSLWKYADKKTGTNPEPVVVPETVIAKQKKPKWIVAPQKIVVIKDGWAQRDSDYPAQGVRKEM